jgi:hypothetical protein
MATGEEQSSHSVLNIPLLSMGVLELVNCHHEGLASFLSVGLRNPTQRYAYALMRKL